MRFNWWSERRKGHRWELKRMGREGRRKEKGREKVGESGREARKV